MTTQGPFLSTVQNATSEIGPNNPGPFTWSNISRFAAKDGSLATASATLATGSDLLSDTVECLGFGFSIPSRARISTIDAILRCKYTTSAGSISSMLAQGYLSNGGSLVFESEQFQAIPLTTLTDVSFSMPYSGLSLVLPISAINSVSFGFSFAVAAMATSATFTVSGDSLELSINYSSGAACRRMTRTARIVRVPRI